MTRDHLQTLKREAGRYTGPSGRPVVILGANDFNALVSYAERLERFYYDAFAVGFMEGLSEKDLEMLAKESGLWGEEVKP